MEIFIIESNTNALILKWTLHCNEMIKIEMDLVVVWYDVINTQVYEAGESWNIR